MLRLAMIGSLVFLGMPSFAADPAPWPKELAIVPNDAMAFVSLNAEEAGKHPTLKGLLDALIRSPVQEAFTSTVGLKLEDIVRATIVVPPPTIIPGERRVPPPQPIFILTARKPLDQAAILKAGMFYTLEEARAINKRRPGATEKPPEPAAKPGASHYVNRTRLILAFANEHTLVLAINQFNPRIEELNSPPSPLELLKPNGTTTPLAGGVALALTKPLAFALNMTVVRRLAEADPPPNEALPLLKADDVTGYATLTDDAANFTVKAGFAGKQWSADGAETANALKTLIELALADDVKRTRKREGDDSPMAEFQNAFVKMARDATVKQAGNDVVAAAKFPLDDRMRQLLVSLPGVATESEARMKSMNNLKQIALALHNYHDSVGTLPGNIYDKNGKALLSWRVHLLPYLEEAVLYKEFKLDEPWDSENNKKLIGKMTRVYALPGVKTKEPGMTFYRCFISPKGAAVSAIQQEGNQQRRTFANVTDGLSNTFFCVEADEPCIWTKPDDLPFDPRVKVVIRGGNLLKNRFQAAFLDGSVRVMTANMPEATLKARITINGGEIINDD